MTLCQPIATRLRNVAPRANYREDIHPRGESHSRNLTAPPNPGQQCAPRVIHLDGVFRGQVRLRADEQGVRDDPKRSVHRRRVLEGWDGGRVAERRRDRPRAGLPGTSERKGNDLLAVADLGSERGTQRGTKGVNVSEQAIRMTDSSPRQRVSRSRSVDMSALC